MIFGALKAFGLLSAGVRWSIILAVVIAAIGAGGTIYYKIWSRGYERALTDIAKQDAKAIAKATEYRNAWRECRDGGLRWDQSTGKCEGR